MIKQSFNGTILPRWPFSYSHAVISYQSSTGRYYLLYSSGGFGDINGVTVFLRSSTIAAYVCIPESSSWTATSLNIEEGTSTFISVDKTTNVIWTKSDIVDLVNSTSSNYIYAMTGSDPVDVVAADQPVADFGWDDGGRDGQISRVSTITLVQGWSVAGKVAILAVAPDGGNLRVDWYKNGAKFKSESGGAVLRSDYKPSANSLETYTLQCYLYNTFNGTVTGGTSHVITIRVVADTFSGNTGGDSGGTGGGSGGTGDGETTLGPEVPTLSINGANATYYVGDTAEPLTASASVSDGGSLSYAWVEGTDLVGFDASFTPPTTSIGVFCYQALAINTLNGENSVGISDTIIITVLPREEKGFDKTSFAIGFADGVEAMDYESKGD